MKSPGEYESERKKFVAEGFDALKRRLLSRVPSPTAADMMMERLEKVINEVLVLAKPIQKAGGALKPDDVMALRHHVFAWTMERFSDWDRDMMVVLCTTLIAERIMQDIDADPWASGTKDVLAS